MYKKQKIELLAKYLKMQEDKIKSFVIDNGSYTIDGSVVVPASLIVAWQQSLRVDYSDMIAVDKKEYQNVASELLGLLD